MEKTSKLKVVGLTLAGLSVLASGSALAANLKVGGSAQVDFVWFDDDVDHPHRGGSDSGVDITNFFGQGPNSNAAALSTDAGFENSGNVTQANVFLRGTLMDRWVYNVSVNAGSPGPLVEDAWVGWDKWDPWFRFSVGRMNAYQGLENTGSRSAYTFIAPAAGQRSFVNGRVNGMAVEGNPFKWMGYQAGVYFHTNSRVPSGTSAMAMGTGANVDSSAQVVIGNNDNNKSLATGRVFFQPMVKPGKVVHVGGFYSYVQTTGDVTVNAAPGGYFANTNAPLVRLTTATSPTTTGVNRRTDDYNVWGLEGLFVWGPFHVQGEYLNFDLDMSRGNTVVKNTTTGATTNSVEANGWYVQGSWMLTGESRNYDPVSGTLGKVTPRNAKWGAWELAARYDVVDLAKDVDTVNDGTATFSATNGWGNTQGTINGGEMTDWTIGLNWYPNQNVKLMANYTQAEAEYGKFAGVGPNFQGAGYEPKADDKRTVDMFALKAQVDF